jgi:quercetin dioxygenase-like cupin family protein
MKYFYAIFYQSKLMPINEILRSKTYILKDTVAYMPNSVVSKTIFFKISGNVRVVALDTGQVITENISAFDSLIQIIDGAAEILIDNDSYLLHTGEAIVIPAHTSNLFRAVERFKMISTVIKSGYEGITL